MIIGFSGKCGVIQAKVYDSLKSPLCSCVSITLRVLSLLGVPIRKDNERYAQSQRTKGNQ
jgi:hypothetical protein